MRCASLFAGLLLLLGGCTSSTDGEATPAGSTTIPAESITVVVGLPNQSGILFGPATGRILAADGSKVGQFVFDSGWDTPPDWNWDDPTPPRSNALTKVEVELPAPGTYTFEFDEFTVSGSPCGTCEAGFAGGSVTTEVVEGSIIELPAGEMTSES